jgi:hypothetical protein
MIFSLKSFQENLMSGNVFFINLKAVKQVNKFYLFSPLPE